MEPTKIKTSIAHRVENMIRCKWSLHILGLIRRGIRRPGAIERASPGLTTKVLNERLVKMVRFEILTKKVYPVSPPRVDYALTPFGKRFIRILDAIRRLD